MFNQKNSRANLGREQNEAELIEEIKLASVICIVYAVDKDTTMERVFYLSISKFLILCC